MVSADSALKIGTFRAIPLTAVNEAGSVVLPACAVVCRRWVMVAASFAGLARKAIFSRAPAASVSVVFVEAAADRAALRRWGLTARLISGANEGG